ncbi:hypothetical protein ElyMa_004754700 [Elysia marginata]|uniref:Uncharacterized protein n=1 Tax=Elysia marginata TaxID=1093978 RepID=A0AAV4IFS0_9GAST|nr:hypothetical protein ElyMa_004754700 [Elysia marginata]
MEYFGFGSGSSQTGPAFPYMPESVLTSYPNTLLEHPVVPTAVGILNTYIQTPDTKNLISVVQTWADKSLELLEKPTVQALGIGLSASLCAYSAWRIKKRWRKNTCIVMGKNSGLQFLDSAEVNATESFLNEAQHTQSSFDGDSADQNSDRTLRQLSATRNKLNELRYQLNQLEGEKDMLAAEVSMRKKIVAQLQGEIHVERDKRRQAELRMEMMEWENTHLRRLRKDVAEKEGKIDILEACIKEKDEIHDKLFQENVILPKGVAEARAKEYEILHTKVQKYEMEAVMKRNSEAPYKPTRYESITSTLARTPFDDNTATATMETALQPQRPPEHNTSESYIPSEWDQSPPFTGSAFQPVLCATNLIDKTRTLLYSSTNWSNSAEKKHGRARVGQRTCEKRRLVENGLWKEIEMEPRSKKLAMSSVSWRQNSKDTGKTRDRNGRLSPECSPGRPVYNTEEDEHEHGVLGQLKSFFSGFSNSGSESGFAAPGVTPAQMTDLPTPSSVTWDEPFEDKANNCCQLEDGEDDAYCPSVSDGQSSVFMSASCGSDTSDDDTRDVSRSCKHSCSRRHSLKRTVSPEKGNKFKRNKSTGKGGSLKSGMLKGRSKSSDKEPRPNNLQNQVSFTQSKNVADREKLQCNDKQVITDINPPVQEIDVLEHKQIPHQGRARQRCRLRKSEPKLTTNPNVSKSTLSHEKVQDLSGITARPEETHMGNSLAVPVLQGPQDTNDHDIYKKLARCRRTPIPGSGYNGAVTSVGDANKNSTCATDTDSEESWIVITPATSK